MATTTTPSSRLVVAADLRQLAGSFHAAALASLTPAVGEVWRPWVAELSAADHRDGRTSKADIARVLAVDASNYARWTAGGAVSVEQVHRWMARWADVARPLVLILRADGAAIVAPESRLAEALAALAVG